MFALWFLDSWILTMGETAPWGFPGGSDGKETACNARDPGLIPGWEDPLEKKMGTHSSILAWEIPWAEEPGELQSTGSRLTHTSSQRILPKPCKYCHLTCAVYLILFKRLFYKLPALEQWGHSKTCEFHEHGPIATLYLVWNEFLDQKQCLLQCWYYDSGRGIL